MKKLPKPQSGQALLVILLVMFLGLTVSLTLLSRTTTDIKLSRELEESSRALSAAEAGIEETLRGVILSGEQPVSEGVTYEVTSQPASGGTGVFSLGKIEKENVSTVWLANYGTWSPAYAVDKIRLCWKGADTTDPKIEAIILYKEGADDYKVARGFYEPSGVVGPGENCADPDNSIYSNKRDVSLPLGGTITLLALRLKPVGSDAFVAVDPPGDNSLPSQGTEFISTGKAGDTVRTVRVVKSYPSWPEIFDYVLFSGGGLTK